MKKKDKKENVIFKCEENDDVDRFSIFFNSLHEKLININANINCLYGKDEKIILDDEDNIYWLSFSIKSKSIYLCDNDIYQLHNNIIKDDAYKIKVLKKWDKINAILERVKRDEIDVLILYKKEIKSGNNDKILKKCIEFFSIS